MIYIFPMTISYVSDYYIIWKNTAPSPPLAACLRASDEMADFLRASSALHFEVFDCEVKVDYVVFSRYIH